MVCENMTEEQKQECIALGVAMDRIKTFPGGSKFITEILLSVADDANLALIDKGQLEALWIVMREVRT